MKRITLIVTSLCCLCLSCLDLGCKAAWPQTFDQTLQAIDKAREIARETGTAFSVKARVGPLEAYQTVAFGVRGVEIEMVFFGNAKLAGMEPPT